MLSILGEKVIDMSKEDSKTTSQKTEQIILFQLSDVFENEQQTVLILRQTIQHLLSCTK